MFSPRIIKGREEENKEVISVMAADSVQCHKTTYSNNFDIHTKKNNNKIIISYEIDKAMRFCNYYKTTTHKSKPLTKNINKSYLYKKKKFKNLHRKMEKCVIQVLTITICTLAPVSNGAKILAVIAVPSFSHQSFFRPLWLEYLERGHELTLITTDPMQQTHPNLHQIDVSMVYDDVENQLQRMLDQNGDKFTQVNVLYQFLFNATRRELLHPEVQTLFSDKTIEFDLLLIEDIAPAMYIFKQRFNVPCIAVSSFDVPTWTHDFVGNPVHPLLYPNGLIPVDQMSDGIFKRFIIVSFEFFVRRYYENYLIAKIDEMVHEVLPDIGYGSSVLELQKQVDMLFTNANPLFAGLRPFAPTTISLAGGLHTSGEQNMSTDLQTFLDNSPEGVVYFSLGSNIKSSFLSSKLLDIFLEAFRELPYNVLWISDLNQPNLPSNVKITKWCSQQAVLHHKHIKLFITQAGLQSLEESLLSGVPILAIPFVMDQSANAKRVVTTGMGLELNYKTLTVEEFKAAILHIANNIEFKNTAVKYATLIKDKPMTPLQEAVWYTEYLLRHEDVNHLKIKPIPAYQYYFIDLILFCSFWICLTIYILYCVIKAFLGIVCDVFNLKKATKQKIN